MKSILAAFVILYGIMNPSFAQVSVNNNADDGGMWYTYSRAPNNGPFVKKLSIGSYQ